MQNEAVRAYIYRVIVALIPVLVALGVIAGDDVQLYLNLLSALLGFGSSMLATKHTSRHPDTQAK